MAGWRIAGSWWIGYAGWVIRRWRENGHLNFSSFRNDVVRHRGMCGGGYDSGEREHDDAAGGGDSEG